MMMTPLASSCLPAAKTRTFVLLGTDWLSGGKALSLSPGHVSFSSLENHAGKNPWNVVLYQLYGATSDVLI
jgi:hypothetical protein